MLLGNSKPKHQYHCVSLLPKSQSWSFYVLLGKMHDGLAALEDNLAELLTFYQTENTFTIKFSLHTLCYLPKWAKHFICTQICMQTFIGVCPQQMKLVCNHGSLQQISGQKKLHIATGIVFSVGRSYHAMRRSLCDSNFMSFWKR